MIGWKSDPGHDVAPLPQKYIYFKISSAHYPFVYPSTLQTPVTIYETARCSWLFINCDLLKPEAHAVANRTIH